MATKPVVLKVLLQHRHLQTHRAFCREYDKVAADVDLALRGGWPSKAQFYRWLSGELIGLPYSDHCRILEGMFPGWKVAQLFQTHDGGLEFIPEPAQLPTLRPDPNTDHTREAETNNNCDLVKTSQRSWHNVRKYASLNQRKLHSRAAERCPPSWRLPQTPTLSQPSWLPDTPIPLEDIELEWEPNPPEPIIVGQEPEVRALLPLRTRRQTFPSYSSAIRYLSPPALFENRPCYRLLGATLSTDTQARLRFGQSCYFDKIDVSEALVHELSSVIMNATDTRLELPFRSLITDPFDLALRTANTSVVTLTIRRDPTRGEATFFLLRRDAAKVATGVVNTVLFQPASFSRRVCLRPVCGQT